MPLQITQREMEGIAILDLHGSITFGEDCITLGEALDALRKAGQVNVILNLKEVAQIDSEGLSVLASSLVAFQKCSGKLALVNLDKTDLELLVLSKLSLAFEPFEDEREAVNSFFPERDIKRYDILEFVQEQAAKARESPKGEA